MSSIVNSCHNNNLRSDISPSATKQNMNIHISLNSEHTVCEKTLYALKKIFFDVKKPYLMYSFLMINDFTISIKLISLKKFTH